MPKYNTTVKKYNNKKKKQSKKTASRIQPQPEKGEELVEDNKKLTHEENINKKPESNKTLVDAQDKNTLAHSSSNKIISISLCLMIGIVTLTAILLTQPNLFNYSQTPTFWVLSYPIKITIFILFFLSIIFSVCFVTFSNKTNIQAFNLDIILYGVLCLMLFTSNLLLFGFNLFVPNCIVFTIISILAIYITYRFFVSNIVSGILSTFATLCLFYCLYVSYGFVFIII